MKLLKLLHKEEYTIEELSVSEWNNNRSMHIAYNNKLKENNEKSYWGIPSFYRINNINILKNNINFEYTESTNWIYKIEIEIKSDNIIKEFWPKFFTIFIRKEYSDFIWPLWLAFIILFIIFVKLILFFL